VTIYVTDVDDAPKIRDRAASGANGQRTITYAENGTGYVARFTASDPEGAMPVVWSLTTMAVGDVEASDIEDRLLFKIDQNGVLSFKDSPDSEAPADDGEGNEYRVTVQASDGTQSGYFKVTVDVTDREETGKVTWDVTPTGVSTAIAGLRQFQPGAFVERQRHHHGDHLRH
jgi:hypothetical protein